MFLNYLRHRKISTHYVLHVCRNVVVFYGGLVAALQQNITVLCGNPDVMLLCRVTEAPFIIETNTSNIYIYAFTKCCLPHTWELYEEKSREISVEKAFEPKNLCYTDLAVEAKQHS